MSLLLLFAPGGLSPAGIASGEATGTATVITHLTKLFSFEGGTPGATIGTGDTPAAGDAAWQVVAASAQVAEYSAAFAAHGTQSGRFAKVASGSSPYVAWTSGVLGTTVAYARTYLYVPAATGYPPAGLGKTPLLQLAAPNALLAAARLTTTGKLNLFGTFSTDGTVTVPFGTWVRIELKVTLGAAGTGSAEARMWTVKDAVGPADSVITATGVTVGAGQPCSILRLGIAPQSSNAFTWAGGIYFDDPAFSDVDEWIGPVAPPPARTASPAGISSGEAAGIALLVPGPVTLTPGGAASGQACGTPQAHPGPAHLNPGGIATGSGTGAPAVSPGPVTLHPAGIASAAGCGTPQAHPGARNVALGGIAPAWAAGTPQLHPGPVTLTITGLPAGGAAGQPLALPGPVTVEPAGTGGAETFGDAFLGGGRLEPVAITGAAATGQPRVLGSVTSATETGPGLVTTGGDAQHGTAEPDAPSHGRILATAPA